MKKLLLLLLPVLLAACATAPAPRVAVADIARSEAVVLHDARPRIESERKIMSYLITSDAYGVYRDGDVASDPSALRLLQHRVFENRGGPATLTVHHFVSYRNLQSQLRRSVGLGLVLGPIIGGIVVSRDDNDVALSATVVDRGPFEALSADDEWQRAAYSAAENPNNAPVRVSYLDADIDGRRAFVRVVSSLQVADGKNAYVEAIESTIRHFLAQLANTPPGGAAASPAATNVPGAVSPVPASAAGASPASSATAAMATALSASPTGARPPGARHVDAAMLQGHTLVYPHPRDPARFHDVRLSFDGDRVQASNARGTTTGHFTVRDDMLCVNLDSAQWGKICYYLIDGAQPGAAPRLLFVSDGKTTTARLE